MNSKFWLAVTICAGGLWMGCGTDTSPSSSIPAEHLDSVAQDFNRGIALMERFQPAEAVLAFEEVVKQAPGWAPGHLNLGIALLNLNEQAAMVRAEAELQWVAKHEPENPYALYSLGVLLRHNDRGEEAKALFERVLLAAPGDPDAHYQLGILAQDTDVEQARFHLEQTLVALPHHQSACYRLAAILRKAGESHRAGELLDRFRTLKDANAGVEAGMKYGEMGRYADVIRNFDQAISEKLDTTFPAFAEIAAANGLDQKVYGLPSWPGVLSSSDAVNPSASLNASTFGPGVAVADVDGDRDLDLFLPGCGTNGRGVLYLNHLGAFTAKSNSGINGLDAIGSFFGDFDKDGDPDLFLTCFGPDRIFQNDGSGTFTDITAACGVAGDDCISVGAAWADIDHDNDLDLLVARYGRCDGSEGGVANSLWRNNGDGSFIDVAAEAGLDGGERRSLGVALIDLDDDRDLDLLFLHRDSDNQVFLNDRVGVYRPANGQFPELAKAGDSYGIVCGDVDQNGLEDLIVLRGPATPKLFLQSSPGSFTDQSALSQSLSAFQGACGALLGDYDLDGDLDLLLLDAGLASELGVANNVSEANDFGHTLLYKNDVGGFHPAIPLGKRTLQPQSRGAASADLNNDGTLDLLIARPGAAPQLWSTPPMPDRNWLKILPTLQKSESGIWAEPDAVDLVVEMKTGLRTQLRRMQSTSGYLGSTPRQLHFGLGTATAADYVRLSWLDAVLQSELEVPAGQLWQINKIKRKPSSCPILFSWDGERFAYVTDFLGVGGMGFFMSPGEYAPPDPTEDVRIPPQLVSQDDGRYLLRVAEPLEEVTYLDQLYLQVIDHPSDWKIYPDERFTGSPPFPTGKPLAVAHPIFPQSAQSDTGVNLLSTLRHVDRQYAEPPIDSRFVGYARDHWIELDFGDRLSNLDPSDPLILYLHGWVEYTYSHVNYAAWQAGITMRSPWIELPDGNGGWIPASPEMGFPAGLPRMMTVDISKLPLQKDGRLRIRTNMEVFWDQIYASVDVSKNTLIKHKLAPVVAELRTLGYPREYSPDGSNPTVYDYHRLDLGVPFKNLRGSFTKHGDVRELLQTVDDRFVILARGEEVALEFDASQLPSLPENWSRTLILHSDGYCKDMDLYTAFPDTIEPLPFHGMLNYPPKDEK
jgi:tetratricopeptide (TPR) repeat protein